MTRRNFVSSGAAAAAPASPSPAAAPVGWFEEAKFGLFNHWGLYSLLGRGEWVMFREKIPPEEYAKLAAQFRPDKFDASAWASHALEAGMHYGVLTTRHHDGFCLWDSRASDFTSVRSAAKHDFVADYVTAFRKAGLRVGLYFSLLDWRMPAYWSGPEKDPAAWKEFVGYVHAQVRELCTNYGRIDVLWFDGCWPYDPESWRAEELLAMARQLQPGILINDRTRLAGDFDTPENQIIPSHRRWESCQTLQVGGWGYVKDESRLLSLNDVLRKLILCSMGGGNFLLNVGPRPDGTFPDSCVERLRQTGAWLKAHGGGIYGSERIHYDLTHWHTRKGKTLYVHFLWDLHWPSWGREYWIHGIPERVTSAFIPSTGQQVKVRWTAGKVCLLDMPKQYPQPLGTVALRLA